MRALIIDDSLAMRKILNRIIAPLGFEILEAENGQLGYDLLRSTDNIEVIMLDWNMPVMNGLEFIEIVRGHSEYATQKIIMVTTETEPSQMVKALMAGVDEFVMKPFTADILIEKMKLIGVRIPVSQEAI